MYKTLVTLDSQVPPMLEEMQEALLTCWKQEAVPGQNSATRKLAYQTARRRIKELADEAVATVQQSAILAVTLCQAAERLSPEEVLERLQKWQTDEEGKPPKGGNENGV